MGDDLDWKNIQEHGEWTVMQNYLHGDDKGVRLADEIVTEVEEWKQKVIKCAGDISCILKKLYYMNLKFDYS